MDVCGGRAGAPNLPIFEDNVLHICVIGMKSGDEENSVVIFL